MTAEKEPRKLSAEFVAAAGRVTVTAAVSREADSVDVAGLWTAVEDMELGTADGAAGTAAENTQAAMSEVVEVETEAVAAADKKAESEGSGMEAAENMEAAAAGDEGFAGCNTESGFAAHMHWGPAVHKEESTEEEGRVISVMKVFHIHTQSKIMLKKKKIQRPEQLTGNVLEMPPPIRKPPRQQQKSLVYDTILGSNKILIGTITTFLGIPI